MSSVSRQEVAALPDAYDFSRITTLVDVGGGRGLVLAGLLKRVQFESDSFRGLGWRAVVPIS